MNFSDTNNVGVPGEFTARFKLPRTMEHLKRFGENNTVPHIQFNDGVCDKFYGESAKLRLFSFSQLFVYSSRWEM
jgi:hypothetical protein